MKCASEKRKPQLPPDSLAGIKGSRGREEQLEMYGLAKGHQELISSHILACEPDLVKQAQKLIDCGSILIFRNYYQVAVYLLRHGFFCKQHLICPGCALRRAAVYTQTYASAVSHLLGQNSWLPVLITFTIRNQSDLSQAFEHVSGARRKLMQSRRESIANCNGRLRTFSILHHVHGGAGSYEFKRGRNSGLWHPHIHEVALISRDVFRLISRIRENKQGQPVLNKDGSPQTVLVPIDFETSLRQEWEQITSDSWRVDVRVIDFKDPELFFFGISEVFKYALKFQQLEPADQIDAYRVLKTRRLIYSYGCLRNLEIPDESRDIPEIDLSNEPWIEEELHWLAGQYRLKQVREPDKALFPDEIKGTGRRKAAPKRGKVTQITQDQVRAWMDAKTANMPF